MKPGHTTTPTGKLRARGVGLKLEGNVGKWNAITDVAGVHVGYCTLIEGESVRTGVTAILPRPVEELCTPVFAGFHSLNGNGELTGTIWAEESGQCDGPITITNTHSCGLSRDSSIKWMHNKFRRDGQWALPVAGETYDGVLNDINGFHIAESHVFTALDNATSGPIEEGSVGGGTGMICYGYKGGSGTASRIVELGGDKFTLGVFLQANFGLKKQLCIEGVPIGRLLNADEPASSTSAAESGSVIGILATDAPLLPHQLKRLARRMGLGIGRSGAISGHGSGDIFLAFSTANPDAHSNQTHITSARFIANSALDVLFEASIEATNESVLNALFANDSMTGYQGNHIEALPIKKVMTLLGKQ